MLNTEKWAILSDSSNFISGRFFPGIEDRTKIKIKYKITGK